MLAFRAVQQSNHFAREEFLYELKAGPAGGRLRRPSSAGNATSRCAAALVPSVWAHAGEFIRMGGWRAGSDAMRYRGVAWPR
jgi:hypothetical protein